MLFRRSLLTCVCVSSLLGCGHPIRELVGAAKDLVPEEAPKSVPTCTARPTTRIELIANLDGRSEIAPSWDPARPDFTSNFQLDSSAYAADGQPVEVRFSFARSGEHTWDWHVLAGEPALERGNGELIFDDEGALIEARTRTLLRLPRADGSLGAPVVLWLGTAKGADADGFDGVTSSPEPSQLISYEQDGQAHTDDCTET